MNAPSEIVAFLNTLGVGTISIGSIPSSPDATGVLYEYGGQSAERRYGITGVGYENPAFQLVFRGVPGDYSGPRAKAETCLRALMGIQPGKIIPSINTIYLTLDPQQAVFPVIPIDANNRHHLGFNFYVKKEPSV